ncbi:MAG: bifunctional sulfate adenylyltransferase/adenylylsulfate kinase [Anaerolineae bacterium]|nr:bifunctional sulfate adenylyltransferase/adenylylsulfate kinase [Anaerolineae bacterium]
MPLISPYGGSLVDLRVPEELRAERLALASTLPGLQISTRAVCDLEMLAVGGFSPLRGFMGAADLASVLETLRLVEGTLGPMPITLPVGEGDAAALHLDGQVVLRDPRNIPLAILTLEEIYRWDWQAVAQQVAGTLDPRHPLVAELPGWGPWNVAGSLEVMQLPPYVDFKDLRLTPAQTRAQLAALGRDNVVAFQTRNPMHRVHEELTRRAIEQVDGTLLLQPAVGLTRPGDVDHFTRVRTYRALLERYYPAGRAVLALLPLAMRMAGPREALWHALIRRNYGANHFIVGRDHAGPGNDAQGRPFYGPYAAQDLVREHAAELGVQMVPFSALAYLPDEDRYEEAERIAPGTRTLSISGTQVREDYLEKGRLLPDWFTRPEVAEILAQSYPPRHRQGVCVWFTGLSGAGKTTTADLLTVLLMEHGRTVTVLDGDVVRTHLSKGLGFSKADRDTNILRIGFVAAEVVRHGGVAICAAVSPYAATRQAVRALVGAERFVEVFVDTPLAVCEARDSKGLYARARRGELVGFTGIDDPYEPPLNPEIALDTVACSAEENARRVLGYLAGQGWVG